MFFFFQAEDGIRDGRVTGVQTCALPICLAVPNRSQTVRFVVSLLWPTGSRVAAWTRCHSPSTDCSTNCSDGCLRRSEERRVGKSVDLGGCRIIKKKTYNNRQDI